MRRNLLERFAATIALEKRYQESPYTSIPPTIESADRKHRLGCLTLRLQGYRHQDAEEAYRLSFGSNPHYFTMALQDTHRCIEALERAVRTKTPIESSASGQRLESLCTEYAQRFGHPVVPGYWLDENYSCLELIQEALDKGRRRWILELGYRFEDASLSIRLALGADANKLSLNRLKLRCVWLDPVEWVAG